MTSRSYPADVLSQAADILAACKQINPNMPAGALTQAAFAQELMQAQAMQAQIVALEMQLTDLRNRRDARLSVVWESVKRVRASVKGAYGDDSSEYQLVGGTRRSERKRPARRAAGQSQPQI
jgi:hypothetical protein